MLRQLGHVENVQLLLGQNFGDLGEELFEGPHPLRVDLQKSGQQRGDVLLDSGAEQTVVGQVPAPLNRSVFTCLNTCKENFTSYNFL